MSSQKNPFPLALEWLCFLRDHGQDLKLSKEARVLGSVLVTYGKGEKIFATMVTLSEKAGMKRETVRKARQELEDKGLLEDITGKPKSEKQERTYRLKVPGCIEDGSVGPLQAVPERTTPGPLEDHPVVPERTTRGPQEDHNIKTLDQGLDEAVYHHADDAATTQSQSQTRAPAGPGRASSVPVPSAPGAPSADSPADGEAVDGLIDWSGNDPDEDGMTNRDILASCLGVPVEKIHPSLWRWLGDLGLDAYSSDAEALTNAANASAGKQNPPGHFKVILPSFVAEARAKHDAEVRARQAEAQVTRERAGDRACYLLMDPAERTDMVTGALGDAAQQRDPEDRILAYLVEHDELDARSGLPEDLADLGTLPVLDICTRLKRKVELCGHRDMQRFKLTDEARAGLAPDFTEEAIRYRLAKRLNGITEYELPELDEDLGLPKGTTLSVLKQFTESGYAEKSGSYYRIAG